MDVDAAVQVCEDLVRKFNPDSVNLVGYGKPVLRQMREDGFNTDKFFVDQSPGVDVEVSVTFHGDSVGRILGMV